MNASNLMNYKNWVVVGDVLNSSKYAYKILNRLKNEGYNVSGVNPKIKSQEIFTSLKDVKYKIDVIDLCINPKMGIKILEEASELNIDKILIQPGAESKEILDYCKYNNVTAIEGCALVELQHKNSIL